MEDVVSLFDKERAQACQLHLKAMTQEVDQLERCVDRVVGLDGIKQKCHHVDMTRAMIIQSARQLRQYKCDEWAIKAYEGWYEYWSHEEEGRYD